MVSAKGSVLLVPRMKNVVAFSSAKILSMVKVLAMIRSTTELLLLMSTVILFHPHDQRNEEMTGNE